MGVFDFLQRKPVIKGEIGYMDFPNGGYLNFLKKKEITL